IILAVGVHLFVSRAPVKYFAVPYFALHDPDNKKAIEVERWNDKPVVQTSRGDDALKLFDKKAEHAGEFRNRVEKETRARELGRFSEGSELKGNNEIIEGEESPEGTIPSEKLRLSDLMSVPRSPNRLSDDIEEGNQTM